MKKINLAISGCLGRMGQQLIRSSRSNKSFKLVALTENKIFNKKIAGIKLNLKNLGFDVTVFLGIHLKSSNDLQNVIEKLNLQYPYYHKQYQ